MSTENQHENNQPATADDRKGNSQDDFVMRGGPARGDSQKIPEERRLHLRAFDYWHGLHGETSVPLFAHLTAEGLSPFKRNCLLLEFIDGQLMVRFCGSDLSVLLGDAILPGSNFSEVGKTGFAQALLSRLEVEDGRMEAAEFEFEDGFTECRGVLLPFSARGDAAEFTMVVINHRQVPEETGSETVIADQVSEETPPQADAGHAEAFDQLANACRQAGEAVVHPGASTREGLYLALAEAYRFHIDASKDPASYRRYLRKHKLRQQMRAPFTPALKLTFGLDYEKTRLTEYAAALSYAARHEVGPDHLSEFLKQEPGGIKGCVARERAYRRGGSTPEDTAAMLREEARQIEAKSLENLSFTEEYQLVLVRDDGRGNKAVLSVFDTSSHLVDRALSAAVKQNSDE